MEQSLQVIELRQLPIIEEKLHAVKEQIERETSEAISLICTEETYKTVKEARSTLNARFDMLEKQRISVKKQIMAPYEAFESIYKECVSNPFKAADAELKAKISDVESGIKGKKLEDVQNYFIELAKSTGLPCLQSYSYCPTVTMSISTKKLKEQAKAFVDRVVADVEMISTLPEHTEIMVEYCSNGFLATAAIQTIQNRIKAKEEQSRREEEYRQKTEARRLVEYKVSEACEVGSVGVETPCEIMHDGEISEPEKQENSIIESRFWCRGTVEQLRALKTFMERSGIEYGNSK